MRAFIVRPFGKKTDRKGNEVDFDLVERDLIDPVLKALRIEGRTTQEIAAAGNIREDMFRLLIAADVVVADTSIHNANVFYELGIRHALRARRTFLIRCRADDTVFDLQTDRYLEYDRERPGESRDQLTSGLRQTLDSDRKDSPVFLLLPELQVQPRSLLLTVPQDFGEEIERAAAEQRVGDLELLAEEARGFEWESVGLRTVGRAQFRLGAHEGAKVTWEAVREVEGAEDLEANTLLGTIYQRLGDLVRSDEAVQRALKSKDATPGNRAELLSLLGRNAKTRWLPDWRDLPPDDRRQAALRSPWLDEAATAYGYGFAEDRNHFYSGLNALAMLSVEIELAGALPEVWSERFDESEDAAKELKARAESLAKLAAALDLSLESARRRLEREGKKDFWTDISEADLRLLTSQRPSSVANGYRRALAAAPAFAVDATRRQLELYRQLGVLTPNVEAALGTLPAGPTAEAEGAGTKPQVVLFTGHMIDVPGRKEPRFPPEKAEVARKAVEATLARELSRAGGVACGIAGGASGGDLLFHEACSTLGIKTQLFLVLPRADFVAASVAPGGPGWIDRFEQAYDRLPRRQLSTSDELPRWLRGKPNYDIWQRNNLWMLHNALALGRDKVTLIALWDGKPGDGPGGTEHMVEKARARGAKVVILDTGQLFGL
jgi:hypothetical protein